MRAEEEARKEGERESGEDEGERTEVEDEGGLSLSGFEEGRVRGEEEVRRRNVKSGSSSGAQTGGVDLSGEVSTDSEWEKVEDGR